MRWVSTHQSPWGSDLLERRPSLLEREYILALSGCKLEPKEWAEGTLKRCHCSKLQVPPTLPGSPLLQVPAIPSHTHTAMCMQTLKIHVYTYVHMHTHTHDSPVQKPGSVLRPTELEPSPLGCGCVCH